MTKKKKPSASGSSKRGGTSSSTSPSSSSLSSTGKREAPKNKSKGRSKAESPPPAIAKKRGGTKRGNARAEAPFALYKDVNKAGISEGFESIVNLLRGRKNIVVLTGAGVSVSCGIPDFRSKGSGLYSTLDHEVCAFVCSSTEDACATLTIGSLKLT